MAMNPYETDPTLIPATDRYADIPAFGRYGPREDDFRPNPEYFMSTSVESLAYWSSVLDLCDESHRIYEASEGGRDVFALGTIVIKSCHLAPERQGRRASRDFSFGDANEVAAISLVTNLSPDIRVPRIYFSGKIRDCDVLVQERIPGVALNVAWHHLSPAQKMSFKDQARDLLRKLQNLQPPPGQTTRSYLLPDPDPVQNRGLMQLEHDMMFSEENTDPDLSFMHHDFNTSNIIVHDDKIVGLIDWEMAGYFGWKTAGKVHARIRCPQAEDYLHLNLPKKLMNDILFWNDLYDVEVGGDVEIGGDDNGTI